MKKMISFMLFFSAAVSFGTELEEYHPFPEEECTVSITLEEAFIFPLELKLPTDGKTSVFIQRPGIYHVPLYTVIDPQLDNMDPITVTAQLILGYENLYYLKIKPFEDSTDLENNVHVRSASKYQEVSVRDFKKTIHAVPSR